jgi:hypothetical protein
MTLTLPSSELRTKTGAGGLASTVQANPTPKSKKKILENALKRITRGFLNRAQV